MTAKGTLYDETETLSRLDAAIDSLYEPSSDPWHEVIDGIPPVPSPEIWGLERFDGDEPGVRIPRSDFVIHSLAAGSLCGLWTASTYPSDNRPGHDVITATLITGAGGFGPRGYTLEKRRSVEFSRDPTKLTPAELREELKASEASRYIGRIGIQVDSAGIDLATTLAEHLESVRGSALSRMAARAIHYAMAHI